MKNFLSKFKWFIAGIITAVLLSAGVVYAFNVTVPQATVVGQIPTGLSSGNYAAGNLIAGSNITITTSTPGQITFSSTGGSGSPGGSPGQVQYNSNSTFAGSASLLTDGTVSGVSATSSTVNFNIQGTTILNPLNVASSSGQSILQVLATNSVTLPMFASSTNSSTTVGSAAPVLLLGSALVNPNSNGTAIGINQPSNSSADFFDVQKGGTIVFKMDSGGNLFNGSNNGTGYFINSTTFRGEDNGGPVSFENGNGGANSSVQFKTNAATGQIDFLPNGSQAMRLTGAGLLGIGTTTPGNALTVVGSIQQTAATSSFAAFDTNGKLIATTSPTSGSLSGGTNGFSTIWTGATTVTASGDMIDNGTVSGINASSSTVNFNVQGTGTNNSFNVASSSGNSILQVLSNNGVMLSMNASSTNSSTTVASTVPILQLGPTALSSPSANGTGIGANFPTSFTGNMFDLQSNATSKISVTAAGVMTLNGMLIGTAGNSIQSSNNTGLVVRGRGNGGGTGYAVTADNGGSSRNGTSGTQGVFTVNDSGTFNPTSGTAVFNGAEIDGQTINQTSTASGISRDLYLAPGVTKAVDFRIFENSAYNYNLSVSYANTPLYGALFNPYTVASSTAGSVPSASMIAISGAPIAGTNITIASSSALNILPNNVTASTTNAYGIYINAPTGATNNYALAEVGNVKFMGTSTLVTPSISGAIVGLGCDSATSSVDSTISSSTTAFITTPQNYPGDGLNWFSYLSAPGVITTKVCSDVTITPSASQYVVKIIQ